MAKNQRRKQPQKPGEEREQNESGGAGSESLPPSQSSQTNSGKIWNRLLLGGALLAAVIVYWPSLSSDWFYDDSDYVLGDPRIGHLELFMPGHWSNPPPPLDSVAGPALVLPGYNKPLISDRYLWHLSFALERRLFPEPYTAAAAEEAHMFNLLLHLACIAALYLAVSHLLKLYREDATGSGSWIPASQDCWRLLPGMAALIFALHPWTSEPVCYVSARNGSMGTLCVLLGLTAWIEVLRRSRTIPIKAVFVALAAFCALAAYGCKENFVTAPVAYVLATLPVIWKRLWNWSKPATLGLIAGVLLLGVSAAWLGIHSSDRAVGLFAQAGDGRGWSYFFHIQNPLLLLSITDQIPVRRISVETNHPGWSDLACWIGLALNLGLVACALIGSLRRPLLLGICWFYLNLLPTNSFLPRPDFLAPRNFYLPTVGMAVLFAGTTLWLWTTFANKRQVIVAAAGVLILYWGAVTMTWAFGYQQPAVRTWEYSSKVAPDHAAVLLNYANKVLSRHRQGPNDDDIKEAEGLLQRAVIAESSPTMMYHTQRPKDMRQSLSFRILGSIRRYEKNFVEAESYFRKSWELNPNVATWSEWAELCQQAKMSRQLDTIIEEGLKRWPNQWWPKALRGVASGRVERFETVSDLEAAENAPNTTDGSLVRLQINALYLLAHSPSGHARVIKLAIRLNELGAPENMLQSLQQSIQ